MKNQIFRLTFQDYCLPENKSILSFGCNVHGDFFCELHTAPGVVFSGGVSLSFVPGYQKTREYKAYVKELYDSFVAGKITEAGLIDRVSSFASEIIIKKYVSYKKS